MRVYHNIRQCLTLQGARANQGRHPDTKSLGVIDDAAVVVDHENVVWVGPAAQLPAAYAQAPREDARGRIWMPALVECHTHLVYGGDRHHDFALRCEGKTYQQIAQGGGGILSTVKATRSTPAAELTARGLRHIERFTALGVGCLEIKSGYGLTLESEIKMLETIQALRAQTPAALVATFLPAHAIPPEYQGRADAFVDAIVSEWIPEIARRKLARFFDVFVEDGYFTVAQARRMAEAAQTHGLRVKLHVDQFTDQSGAALAAQIAATSCDHLDHVSEAGIAQLGKSSTVAVLAPSASLFMNTPFPPARALIDAGAIVALTTDFNPGTCPSHNLPLAMTVACTQMKMTIAEAIVGATYNAAQALGEETRFGTIEAGRPLHVWKVDAPHFEAIPYAFGEI